MSVGKYAQKPEVYGTHANPFVLGYGEIVDVVINNYDSGSHPMRKSLHLPSSTRPTNHIQIYTVMLPSSLPANPIHTPANLQAIHTPPCVGM